MNSKEVPLSSFRFSFTNPQEQNQIVKLNNATVNEFIEKILMKEDNDLIDAEHTTKVLMDYLDWKSIKSCQYYMNIIGTDPESILKFFIDADLETLYKAGNSYIGAGFGIIHSHYTLEAIMNTDSPCNFPGEFRSNPDDNPMLAKVLQVKNKLRPLFANVIKPR